MNATHIPRVAVQVKKLYTRPTRCEAFAGGPDLRFLFPTPERSWAGPPRAPLLREHAW